jgi:hypothetical protein
MRQGLSVAVSVYVRFSLSNAGYVPEQSAPSVSPLVQDNLILVHMTCYFNISILRESHKNNRHLFYLLQMSDSMTYMYWVMSMKRTRVVPPLIFGQIYLHFINYEK